MSSCMFNIMKTSTNPAKQKVRFWILCIFLSVDYQKIRCWFYPFFQSAPGS
uniref:Uncharacterized protein n=1 Tax=Rhizophora mucronata TaxID=61149 RepID=A0A2P2R208_RHIMU